MPLFARRVVPRPWSRATALAIGGLLFGSVLLFLPSAAAWAQTAPEPVTCSGGAVEGQDLMKGVSTPRQPDLLVTGPCKVEAAKDYYYGNVNIVGPNGSLDFEQPKTGSPDINFWASSIIVEANGTLTAGVTAPYGDPSIRSDKQGGFLTIYLYGANQSVVNGIGVDPLTKQGQGVLCKTEGAGLGPCGIPESVWSNNGGSDLPGCGLGKTGSDCVPGLPAAAKDYFYDYAPLYGDAKCTNSSGTNNIVFEVKNGKAMCGADPADGKVGYFGYKVLAVSYGGTLIMNGYKGVATGLDDKPLQSGNSWMRLSGDLEPEAVSLTLAGSPADRWWLPNDKDRDQIVVTTTDYLPGHSEELTLSPKDGVRGNTVNFSPAIKWLHNGTRFAIASKLGNAKGRLEDAGMDPNLVKDGAETRAAVALLTRSIRIVSAGDVAGETFAQAEAAAQKAGKTYYFGGHTIFRQGIREIQIRGVEFADLGQGGKIGHYPIHFHKTRQVPPNTFVDDSSVNDSNTRWYVLHDTQGVTFQRDVGWKSIGHGYYLEDGTEADNNFYSDLGVFARAALADDQNPRLVPGILAANGDVNVVERFPYRTDSTYPTVFWITNGWNNFEGDMAAGTGACGSSYWFVPVVNSDRPDVPTPDNVADGTHMKWSGYAGLQATSGNRGTTPLKTFYNNYATSSMMSFQTTGDVPQCLGVVAPDSGATKNVLKEVKSFAPDPLPPALELQDPYYPHALGGYRVATSCPAGADGLPNCAGVTACSAGNEKDCAVTVLDHYTSSFHWAEGNVSAIWLRPQWYLLENSVLSDVQNGGLTFITGGDYTHASVIPGYWALAKASVFVGHTQPQDTMHGYASDAGPFNAQSGLRCDWQIDGLPPSNYCASKAQGISMPLGTAFALNQRLFHIYDGPAYEDSVAYLDITTTPCPNTGASTEAGCMYGTGVLVGIRRKLNTTTCYLPNAAIAWKQPNGFFYPPAFHSANLYFNNVDIRHYVINPLFKAPDGVTGDLDFGQGGTYLTNTTLTDQQYCTNTPDMFNNFSAIDRQTELSDDDGSLTGLTNNVTPATGTISVNQDPFFAAPVEAPECRSNLDIDPAGACKVLPVSQETQTARTSPYDYVATAVEPQCSQTPVPGQKYGRCGDDSGRGFGGTWSSECTNQACYGIPLYRQFLTGTKGGGKSDSTLEWQHWFINECNNAANQQKPQCRWPFIRMAGENMYQRETLTVNHGTYYMDTTVPLNIQQSEHFNTRGGLDQDFNVFQAGKTYYVYFLYAKPTTQQTYEIYVGKDFSVASLKAVRGNLATAPVIFTDDTPARPSWLQTPNPAVDKNGVLTVTINFAGLSELDPTPANGLCQPHSFCTASGTKCVSTLPASAPRKKDYDEVCGTWAVKDLDCPPKGCLGFALTLPGDFKAEDQGQAARPEPKPFPNTPSPSKPDWLTKFVRTLTKPDDDPPTGTYGPYSCYYQKVPGTDCTPAP